MAKTYEALTDEHRRWIGEQAMFFVASAPSETEGHVNVSPKGYDTFRIIDDHTVAYLDLTGSGIETIAHLRQNGRLTIMFCAFAGKPKILRLYGRGRAVRRGDAGFDELVAHFEPVPGTRSIITLELDRIQSSCGYSIPLMEVVGERETLVEWAEKKGAEGLEEYWVTRNAESIDGLEGIPTP